MVSCVPGGRARSTLAAGSGARFADVRWVDETGSTNADALALLTLVLAPLVWLIALPFRLLGVCVGATFAFIKALLFLPARLLGAPAKA